MKRPAHLRKLVLPLRPFLYSLIERVNQWKSQRLLDPEAPCPWDASIVQFAERCEEWRFEEELREQKKILELLNKRRTYGRANSARQQRHAESGDSTHAAGT